MKLNYISPDRELVEYTLQEVFNLAGVDTSDSDLIRDEKVLDWLDGRKCRCLVYDINNYSAELERAVKDGIDILIIKEK